MHVQAQHTLSHMMCILIHTYTDKCKEIIPTNQFPQSRGAIKFIGAKRRSEGRGAQGICIYIRCVFTARIESSACKIGGYNTRGAHIMERRGFLVDALPD